MPLDETELIVNDNLNSILNDPLKILVGLKEAYSNYEALVENVYTVSQSLKEEAPKFNPDNSGAMPILGTSPIIMAGHRHTGLEKAVNAIERTIYIAKIKDEVNRSIVESLN